MPKIRNTGTPPTIDANPITNHPAPASVDTHPSDKAKATAGGGGV